MGHRKPRKGRASERSITRRGFYIYQKGDQIKAPGGNRWDVASQGTEGARSSPRWPTMKRSTAPCWSTPTAFSIAGYIDWQNAKYGKISARLFCKLHIMHTLHGMACAAVVTPGKPNDSPYLRAMIEMLPEGDGNV